jgi:hypothetical protein
MTAMQAPLGLVPPRKGVGLGLVQTGFDRFAFVGHSGAWSGRLFHEPGHDLFLAGTLNQAGAPSGWHADMLQSVLETLR